MPPLPLILASTSPFRRELLARLALPFDVCAPEVDEAAQPGEAAPDLVRRLAEAKARAGAVHFPEGLVIGSDQVAVLEGEILGKPGSHARAHEQLGRLAGNSVTFHTGLCLYNAVSERVQADVVPFRVHFRELSAEQIERYLEKEQPYNCAGSFKSEGLGITLFRALEGEDPTALIGLPLIRLTDMLLAEGVPLP
ncbi:Maf family protein [Thiohalobacter sp. IOR34]|uniref:Maf family protein n=1 Tax=Thiohalobacter sp. IOR34 TaxID=3057176 RepID=UPI0025B11857|nr:Maf family protein [Thiohalobacter sp. IOR34]WJW74240.1 Maf family protein [Thiohalobacter sp. IOR34]